MICLDNWLLERVYKNLHEKIIIFTFVLYKDYIIKINDSSSYEIVEEMFIHNEDNKLKIFTFQTAISSRIFRMIVRVMIKC